MMELDIDQSHLPRVQEVCQGFAVLEDGALAYNLQEQEIEQFYSSNVQKSQLVQNDIRMAKQLQDEEELRANRIARQIEERDSEYARMIQEELQRCAEDARRREEEDEEMAKRLQEEEEMDSRRQRLDSGCHGDVNDIFLREERASVPERSRPRRPVRPRPSPSPSPSPDSSVSEGETRLPSATRGRSHGSHTDSDSADPPSEPSSPVLQNNSAPQHGSRQTDALRLIRNLLQESLGPSYNVEDEVFLRAPSLPAHRLQKRLNTAPSGHQGPDRHTQGGNRHSISSSVREGERVGEGWEERERVVASRRNGNRVERWHSNSYHGDQRWEEEDYHSREARSQDRVYSRTYTEGGQSRRRHVHFQDDRRRYSSYHGDSRSGTSPGSSYQNNFSDRGVAARRSCYGDFRQAPQRGSQGNRNVQTVGSGSSRHHLSDVLLRNVSVRRSSHGDFSDRRRESGRDGRRAYGNQNTQSGHRASYRENPNIQEDRVSHQGDFRNGRSSQDHRDQGEWEGGSHGNRRGREEEGRADRDHHGDRRVRRSVSERLRASEEPESSSEEEGRWRVERRRSEGGQREERPQGERVHRSISFSGRTPPPAAGHRGTGVTPRRDGASLELSELGQVLQDEELARKLQEEEERLLRKSPPAPRDPQASSPRGDFRAAQVAQDEEIARFMQRSEKKAQRRSCDLEGQGSRRDQRDPDNGQERSARETTMELPQGPRQRLDSQGLNSPTEDLSPDCQPPSPNCVASQLQAVRNIAEELDPTFKAKRRDSNPAGQSSSGLSTSPSSPSGLHDYPQEPTFVPPTKRQSDKSSRPKAKEKKESCKQQ